MQASAATASRDALHRLQQRRQTSRAIEILELVSRNVFDDQASSGGDHDDSLDQVSQDAHSIDAAIELFKRSLSSHLDTIPLEIWQHIFSFFPPGCELGNDLLSVCEVSRIWRDAAMDCHALWTNLPEMGGATKSSSTDTGNIALRIKQDIKTAKIYISRSGTLPLAFCVTVGQTFAAPLDSCVDELIHTLAGACHRWGNVSLRLPLYLMEEISMVVRRVECLPALHSLELSIARRSGLKRHDPVQITGFSKAPHLKSLKIDMRGIFGGCYNLTIVNLNFPWHQLETFESQALHDPSYDMLLASKPTNLVELYYDAYMEDDPRPGGTRVLSSPLILPNLQRFTFKNGVYREFQHAPSHLGSLILPALTYLRYQVEPPPPHVSPIIEVLALVTRSRCSLQFLDLSKSTITVELIAPLFDVLALSPRLTELRIRHLADEDLQRLVYSPSSNLVPSLKRLRIDVRSHPQEQWRVRPMSCSPAIFLDIVRSRLGPSEGEGIDQITICGYNENDLCFKSAELLDIETSSSVPESQASDFVKLEPSEGTMSNDLAVEIQDAAENIDPRHRIDESDDFDPELEFMEDLDLKGFNTRAIVVRPLSTATVASTELMAIVAAGSAKTSPVGREIRCWPPVASSPPYWLPCKSVAAEVEALLSSRHHPGVVRFSPIRRTGNVCIGAMANRYA